jgi:hypothetical protein
MSFSMRPPLPLPPVCIPPWPGSIAIFTPARRRDFGSSFAGAVGAFGTSLATETGLRSGDDSTYRTSSGGSLTRPLSSVTGMLSGSGDPLTSADWNPGAKTSVVDPQRRVWRPVAPSHDHWISCRRASSSRSAIPGRNSSDTASVITFVSLSHFP